MLKSWCDALHKFNGKPGVRNNKSSVKITEIIRRGGGIMGDMLSQAEIDALLRSNNFK